MLTYLSYKILTNKYSLSIARALPTIIFFSTILLGAISSKRIWITIDKNVIRSEMLRIIDSCLPIVKRNSSQ